MRSEILAAAIGDEDRDVLEAIEAYCKLTGAPKSYVVKVILRGAVKDDPGSHHIIKEIRRCFPKPTAPVGARRAFSSA